MSTFLCSVCDIRGKDQIYSTDHEQWIRRDVNELRKWARAYKNAQTLAKHKEIFETYSVQWSSLWLLEYWDPTTMLVIDAMHCILEGLVHYHCRHMLRLDASTAKISSDGLKIAFEWPWVPYSHEAAQLDCQLLEKHKHVVVKMQETLSLSITGKNSITLDQMWTRLSNQSKKGALEFIVHTLGLSRVLVDIDEQLSSLYVIRAKKTSKRKDKTQLKFPEGQQACTLHQLIALLLNWRLHQPHSSDAYLIPTGTPETLSFIQTVIRETLKPSCVESVPKDFGEAKAGSIKVHEWLILSTRYLPIVLVIRWGDNDGLVKFSDRTLSNRLITLPNRSL
ncbi:hypothetical protein F5050DRAFT_1700986 [Lentinula boryana]|uniref:Uncharacterized protein n=1 Tax=Lentinula boryana TaxID=40481 RepID=A0ABQ8PWK7_9AGAR|nr:hypothetical protein F5050DRAFT_1700986 [Lentinula boryana]